VSRFHVISAVDFLICAFMTNYLKSSSGSQSTMVSSIMKPIFRSVRIKLTPSSRNSHRSFTRKVHYQHSSLPNPDSKLHHRAGNSMMAQCSRRFCSGLQAAVSKKKFLGALLWRDAESCSGSRRPVSLMQRFQSIWSQLSSPSFTLTTRFQPGQHRCSQ
jgi:hypothetical protein